MISVYGPGGQLCTEDIPWVGIVPMWEARIPSTSDPAVLEQCVLASE